MDSTTNTNTRIFLDLIQNKSKVILEIGCGPAKKYPDAIGVDILPLPGVDIVHNMENGLDFIPDNTVDEITSSHVLEHINNLEGLMKDIHRILKKGGVHKAIVPHFSNPYYYSDYTHKRFFGLYTFDYFSKKEDQALKRKVPDFYTNYYFIVTVRHFNFKDNFSPRNILNLILAKPLFNRSNYMKELYEDKFCYMFPCQEMYYEMTPVK